MNDVLRELAAAREKRAAAASGETPSKRPRPADDELTRGTPGRSAGQPGSSGAIDLTGDDSDDGGGALDHGDAASLALARRLQAEDAAARAAARQHGDAAMAEALQREELAAAARGPGGLAAPQPRTLACYRAWAQQEDVRRMECEGPPSAAPVVHHCVDGVQRLRPARVPFSRPPGSAPCVVLTRPQQVAAIAHLARAPPKGATDGACAEAVAWARATEAGGPLCACAANAPLLGLLLAWRQHVVETCLETLHGERWSRTTICTSELTFLGTSTHK